MIPIPESLQMSRNRPAEALMLERTKEALLGSERTPGIHASDVMDPRQGYWKTKDPQELSEKQIMLFSVGRTMHAMVLGAMHTGEFSHTETDEGSSYSKELGVWYSPDYISRDGKTDLAEFKTSRQPFEPKTTDDVGMYLEQLLIYMAAENKLEAQLWILFISMKGPDNRTAPAYRVYDVRVTPEDLEAARVHIHKASRALEEALHSSHPTPWQDLDLCRDWKCKRSECPWYDKCKPEGRWSPPRKSSTP